MNKCTCHPSEAPIPCRKRYAFSECQLVADTEKALIEDMREWAKKTDKEVGNTMRRYVIDAYCKDRGIE